MVSDVQHYHFAVRTGKVTLDRPLRSLQQRVTRSVNTRERVFGPLWQGRYKAKLVDDQRYLDQLLVYIHLNPVIAGLVDDPAKYHWIGHRELLVVAGAERYHLQVRSLADAMGKSPDGMSDALARAVRQRTEDDRFRADLDSLDRALAGGQGYAGAPCGPRLRNN